MIDTPQLLISDDDRDFRATLQAVFERRGFGTILAADGAEAVEIVKSETIHVVLIDMHMPRMSGLEAIRRIKELHHAMPCILISAALDALDDTIRDEVDAFSLLEKPMSFRVVNETVNKALESISGWKPQEPN